MIADGNTIGMVKANNNQGSQLFSFDIKGVSLLEFKCTSDCEWSEGTFAPTYKYIPLSDVYLEKDY